MTDTMKARVDAVKAYAFEHYNEDGWDFVIETMDWDEVAEILSETFNDGRPAPVTPTEDISRMAEFCKLLDERRKDIQATAW